MALTTLTEHSLQRFAHLMHQGYTNTPNRLETVVVYAALLPRTTTIGPLELLQLSPLHKLKTANRDGQLMVIELPGDPSLVMFPFSIEGEHQEHLRHMTLPKGSVAFGFSLIAGDDRQGTRTAVAAREARTVLLASDGPSEPIRGAEIKEVGFDSLIAAREVIIRSKQ